MIVTKLKSAARLGRRFLGLPGARKVVLIQALALAVIIRGSLALFPLKDLLRALQRFSRPPAGRRPAGREDILYATALCSRRVPLATCLVNGLAGQYLLARNGYHPTLHIGVKKATDQLLAAHAWVTLDGEVVIGWLDDLATYAPLLATGR